MGQPVSDASMRQIMNIYNQYSCIANFFFFFLTFLELRLKHFQINLRRKMCCENQLP